MTSTICECCGRPVTPSEKDDVTFAGGRGVIRSDGIIFDGVYASASSSMLSVLRAIVAPSERVATKEFIIEYYEFDRGIRAGEGPDMKIVDVSVCKLRKILRAAFGDSLRIETIWGRGYRILVDAPATGAAA